MKNNKKIIGKSLEKSYENHMKIIRKQSENHKKIIGKQSEITGKSSENPKKVKRKS